MSRAWVVIVALFASLVVPVPAGAQVAVADRTSEYDETARPNMRHACSATVDACVHWVDDALHEDAPSLVDADGSGVPDWVEETLGVVERVWEVEVVDLSFEPPEPDDLVTPAWPELNPSPGLDVLLADLQGATGGYCDSDDPRLADPAERGDVSAYCVFDNDFARGEFCPCPPNEADPLRALRQTAAHEVFHAIQFGYGVARFGDCLDDVATTEDTCPVWLIEGTAAWVEDVVYDALDNIYWYLDDSALVEPGTPLRDMSYEAWLWWRFLSDQMGTGLVRDVWERVEDIGADGNLAFEALNSALHARDRTLDALWARYGVENFFVAKSRIYEEGAGYAAHLRELGLRTPATKHVVGGSRRRASGAAVTPSLSSSYAVFVPARGTRGRLAISVAADRPVHATIVTHLRSGGLRLRSLTVNLASSARAKFARAEVRRVVLVMSNTASAGTRFTYRARHVR